MWLQQSLRIPHRPLGMYSWSTWSNTAGHQTTSGEMLRPLGNVPSGVEAEEQAGIHMSLSRRGD